MTDAIKKLFRDAIESRVFPGCVAGITVKGTDQIIACGTVTYDQNTLQVFPETIYDVASVTKAIPVSCIALKLIEDGELRRDNLLTDIIPEYSGSYREKICIDHLLTHTLDFDFRLSEYKALPAEEIIRKILTVRMKAEPGVTYCYANATSILLGLVLERCCGLPLDTIGSRMFFEPLGMNSTFFSPQPGDKDRIVPTEDDPWRGRVIQGEVHDESAWALRPRIAGSAGLFSNVPDLLKFMKMLLQRGECNGKRFFRSKTVDLMHTNQRPEGSGEWCGLGWELNQKAFMGSNCSPDTFGKTGFTGCSIVLDPVSCSGAVLLSNHIFPRRRADRQQINAVRKRLAEIVFGESAR